MPQILIEDPGTVRGSVTTIHWPFSTTQHSVATCL